jgi:hypothetical protein
MRKLLLKQFSLLLGLTTGVLAYFSLSASRLFCRRYERAIALATRGKAKSRTVFGLQLVFITWFVDRQKSFFGSSLFGDFFRSTITCAEKFTLKPDFGYEALVVP